MLRFCCVLVIPLSACNFLRVFQSVDCTQTEALYQSSVEPMLQTQCVTCHNAGGLAAKSGFVLSKEDAAANYKAFAAVTEQVMLKPTGAAPHTGGKILPPGSEGYAKLEKMVASLNGCHDEAALSEDARNQAGEGPFVPSVLPADARRLSSAELDNTVALLLGTTTLPSASLGGDTRQSGFTANLDQRVDATTSDQLFTLALSLADETVTQRLSFVVPCDQGVQGCDRTFVQTFATRAFRRPATTEEIDGLVSVFHTAADGGSFAEGVRAVLVTVLQSSSFLYLSQASAPTLDPYETASVLSYLMTASPPDDVLLAAAAANELATADQKEAQVRRLLASPRADAQLVRFVREWLRLDELDHVDRPGPTNFSALRPAMQAETEGFVKRAAQDGLKVATLVGADFTVINAEMGAFYGLPAGEASLSGTPRRGVLSQAAFLATNAAPDRTSPVKRGARVLSKLLCTDLPLPSGEVGMKAMAPVPPDPSLTTRERFSRHATDATCSSCHTIIDSLGFAFEEFDQLGAQRAMDNGKPVDSTGELTGSDVDGSYTNAADMLTMLSGSAKVEACVTTFVARFATASSDEGITKTFAAIAKALPEDKRQSAIEMLVAYVRSDFFATRSLVQ